MSSRRTSTSEAPAGIHWQANYLQSPATDSPHAPPRVEPHRAAANAALARQSGRPLIPVTHSSDGTFTPLALDQRPFYRLLDEQVSTRHIPGSLTEPVTVAGQDEQDSGGIFTQHARHAPRKHPEPSRTVESVQVQIHSPEEHDGRSRGRPGTRSVRSPEYVPIPSAT